MSRRDEGVDIRPGKVFTELCLSERSFIILSYVQDRAGNSCARLVLSRLW